MRVAFVYPNPRTGLLERVAAGDAPDTALFGLNHLAEHGLDAYAHAPALRRRQRRAGLRHRITWNVRELALPWELGDADVAVTPLANLFPLVARLRRRLRVVLISYHVATVAERASPLRRRLLRASLDGAAAIACSSTASAERLVAAAGIDPGRVRVALLGVDERFWTPSPLPEEGYVLAVGRDLARDYHTFARAVETLPARVVLVAGPPNVTGLQIPANVEVHLDIGAHEVRELYRGAACVVVPTRAEDYPFGTENSGTIAMLEAMACARPVVASERWALRDYVEPGKTVLTVAPEDPAALRAAIDRVLADRALAASLAAEGRRIVEERYTTAALAARLAALIREAAA